MNSVFLTDCLDKELVSKIKCNFPNSLKVIKIYDNDVYCIVAEKLHLYIDKSI